MAFGSTAATNVSINPAGTSLTATAPAGTGTVQVKVTTPGGISAVTTSDQYSYLGVPTVTSVSPASGPVGGGTQVTVTGTNLAGETSVLFGPNAATAVTVNGPGTSLTATAPPGTGLVDVEVANPLATSAASSADRFSYTNPVVRVAGVTQSEGTGGTSTMNFPVTLSAPSPVSVSVNYQTADGTATAPSDYAATSGTVTFPAGQTSLTIPVQIVADSVPEPTENFTVQLGSPVNATLGTSVATGTITNDDAPVLTGATSINVPPPAER